jgi:hypothetical protein
VDLISYSVRRVGLALARKLSRRLDRYCIRPEPGLSTR